MTSCTSVNAPTLMQARVSIETLCVQEPRSVHREDSKVLLGRDHVHLGRSIRVEMMVSKELSRYICIHVGQH